MEQYIPKSAVFAKISGYINNAEAYLSYHHNRNDKSVYAFEQEKLAMCELLSSLDTLEVKEVDLEKAAEDYASTGEVLSNGKVMIDFQAEKAFRAGAKWQRSQLMHNAIEVVISDDTTICNAVELMKLQEKYKGQKVKIAIIKED